MRLSVLAFGTGIFMAGAIPALAQAGRSLTLGEAEQIATRNHPGISAANLTAAAARQVTTEVRSVYFPTFQGSLTGADAAEGSRIAAGAINNPSVFDRFASGLAVGQLITDFGRTATLADASKYKANAQQQNALATREQVLLGVDRAYFQVLRSQALSKVAVETVAARQLIVDQVTALAASKLKSDLDVSFANVNLSEAKLLLVAAENERKAHLAELSEAMGFQDVQDFDLKEEPLPPAPADDVAALVSEAMRDRPDISSRREELQAALKFAEAERLLWRPSISLQAGAGLIPVRDQVLSNRYGAFGVNINIPIFNGHLFSARHAEAELHARAAENDLKALENRVSRDVRLALLDATTVYQRISLTAQLLDQASRAEELAQARYDLGLGSIIELSQAQLNKTSAEIVSAEAKYDYQIQHATLRYQIGRMP